MIGGAVRLLSSAEKARKEAASEQPPYARAGGDVAEYEEADAEATNAERRSCSRVFFAGAHFETDEKVLQHNFEEAGKLKEFLLFRTWDGWSRGMGRASYSSTAEASRATSLLDGRVIDGRKLLVRFDDKYAKGSQKETRGPAEASQRSGKRKASWDSGYNSSDYGDGVDELYDYGGGNDGYDSGGGHDGCDKVFFAGASFDTTLKYLRSCFQEAGHIARLVLFRLPDGRSRGMGICQYSSSQEAEYAVANLHDMVIDGREILVTLDYDGGTKGSCSKWHTEGGEEDEEEDDAEIYSARVFFASADYSSHLRDLRAAFEYYGRLRSIMLFRTAEGRSRGMGVCVYETMEAAARAISEGIEVDGRLLHLQEDQSQYAQATSLGPKTASSYGPSKTRNLGSRSEPYGILTQKYVSDASKAVFFSNVPVDTTESYLWLQFETVGALKSLTLFTTPDGKSRGMGIVEYFSHASASRAYDRLHERIVSGRPLMVDEYRPPSQEWRQ
eukprot:gnl/TRDRNA2_/TRDRNA2_32640_c0_seq1.p1 gnl/TRDRNA2_/TRDRNA2_32640_c0~~gnl/TRDRNA2_/TRDRNA2_32640_c0_seq1.p1  ORF type:complete len:501 (-),score=85.47 gnl/TRDRNA2_/TRDRNA2_32640_c0_seq1:74-1576(-)